MGQSITSWRPQALLPCGTLWHCVPFACSGGLGRCGRPPLACPYPAAGNQALWNQSCRNFAGDDMLEQARESDFTRLKSALKRS